MNTKKYWGIALALIGALALALAACGGGGGNNPGDGWNTTKEPRWLTIEIVAVADTLDVSDAMVSVRWNRDHEWTEPVRYADYQADPLVIDMNAVSPYNGTPDYFRGIAVKLEGPGLFSRVTDLEDAWDIEASGLDTYVARPVVARDLNGAGWSCTMTGELDGVPDQPVTKVVEVKVDLDIDQPYAEHYAGGILAFNDTGFLIIGDRIFGNEPVNGTEVVTTGTVSAPNVFDYKKTWTDKDAFTEYHCER